MNNLNLPGHSRILHAFDCEAGPEQSRRVSTHFRVRVCLPCPHVTEHAPYFDHCPKPPSTVAKKNKNKKNYV